jgi:predicted dehydrogenase
MTNLLRFGVLGAARITPAALVAPAAKLPSVEITRVAARDRGRAEAFAAEHGIGAVSAGYAEVVSADDVDVGFNPLPNSQHAEWTIAALQAGKDVLCEKPLGSNAAEAAEMVEVARTEGRVLGEAFHYRYHPLFERLLAIVASGAIGDIERIEASFAVAIGRPDIRWDYALAGGSLMDLGCYPVSWVRHVPGEEPTVVSAEAVEGAEKIDASITAELAFPSGATGRISSAMDRGPVISLTVTGTDGTIEVENPLAPQGGNALTVTTGHGTTSGQVDAGATYEHMLRAFVDHVIHGTPYPTQGADSVANMAVIDAVYEAAGLPPRGT